MDKDQFSSLDAISLAKGHSYAFVLISGLASRYSDNGYPGQDAKSLSIANV